MIYSYIFTCYILVRMIDAADPEKLIFQKASLLAFDQKKMLVLKQNHIKGHKRNKTEKGEKIEEKRRKKKGKKEKGKGEK